MNENGIRWAAHYTRNELEAAGIDVDALDAAAQNGEVERLKAGDPDNPYYWGPSISAWLDRTGRKLLVEASCVNAVSSRTHTVEEHLAQQDKSQGGGGGGGQKNKGVRGSTSGSLDNALQAAVQRRQTGEALRFGGDEHKPAAGSVDAILLASARRHAVEMNTAPCDQGGGSADDQLLAVAKRRHQAMNSAA